MAVTTIAANLPGSRNPEMPGSRVSAFLIGGIYRNAGEPTLLSPSLAKFLLNW
jgi:hypothetical protein